MAIEEHSREFADLELIVFFCLTPSRSQLNWAGLHSGAPGAAIASIRFSEDAFLGGKRHIMHKKIIAVFGILLAASVSASAVTIVHAGSLIDGVSGEMREQVSVVIDRERIVAVEEGFLASDSDDTLVDLSSYTVLPGLMDMHIHLRSQHSRTSYTERFFMNEADYALQ